MACGMRMNMACPSLYWVKTVSLFGGNRLTAEFDTEISNQTVVYGGGTELALSCDFRVGIEGGRLRVPAAAIGLCYPAAGIARFVEKLGANVSRRMLLASETLESAELQRIGFLDYLVPREQLDERVEELALHIAGLAPLATRAMKELLLQAESGGIDAERAAALATLCDQSDDLQEGFAAQREKRSPRFAGH